jgi:predicted O-methyltransferase YrrM
VTRLRNSGNARGVQTPRSAVRDSRPIPDEVELGTGHGQTLPSVRRTARAVVRATLATMPARVRRRLAVELLDLDPHAVLQPLGVRLNRDPRLETMPLDLNPDERLEFEDLAGLFSSSILNHGIVGMTIRQLAYVFGLARRTGARTVIEVGRWRGGSTLALAAAVGPEGRVWSIDNGEKAERVLGVDPRELDAQTRAVTERFGLRVELLRGDSHTLALDVADIDLALIDGDHTYEGVRADFDRFGRRVRVGGAVLLDDAFPDPLVPSHPESVGRLVREVVADGEFRLVKRVDRLAHLERVA